MLDELSKEHNTWLSYAIGICGNIDDAKDLVSDMYLKIYDKQPNTVNKGYIYRTLKNLHINNVKQKKETIKLVHETLEADDGESLQRRLQALEYLKDLRYIEKIVLLETHEYSLRQCAKLMNVDHCVLNYHKQKGLKKLRNKHGRTKR